MTIDEYLEKYNVRAADLARATLLSEAAISRYRHGSRFPRKEELCAIIMATGGRVTPNDFLKRQIEFARNAAKKQKSKGHTPREMVLRVLRSASWMDG